MKRRSVHRERGSYNQRSIKPIKLRKHDPGAPIQRRRYFRSLPGGISPELSRVREAVDGVLTL
jgi:hypothetical protein